jgi:hypothetical protein
MFEKMLAAWHERCTRLHQALQAQLNEVAAHFALLPAIQAQLTAISDRI